MKFDFVRICVYKFDHISDRAKIMLINSILANEKKKKNKTPDVSCTIKYATRILFKA